MTLEEMLALLPDNTTGAIDAADLRAIVTELYGLSGPEGSPHTVAQVFGYLWTASTNSPPSGRVAVSPVWSVDTNLLRISETTDDGQNLLFTVLDMLDSRIVISGANGGILRGDIIGPTVDGGTYRDIPLGNVTVEGIAPLNGEKVAVVASAWVP